MRVGKWHILGPKSHMSCFFRDFSWAALATQWPNESHIILYICSNNYHFSTYIPACTTRPPKPLSYSSTIVHTIAVCIIHFVLFRTEKFCDVLKNCESPNLWYVAILPHLCVIFPPIGKIATGDHEGWQVAYIGT